MAMSNAVTSSKSFEEDWISTKLPKVVFFRPLFIHYVLHANATGRKLPAPLRAADRVLEYEYKQ